MVPALFISHGSPYLAVETNKYTKFLNELGERIKPKAIVIFTAHWETEELTLTYTDDILETVYDYYGFPEEMYKVKYPVKGSKKLAELLESKFTLSGIKTNREYKRGLDHGSWVALKHIYPKADIPVVQISINPFLSVKELYKIGLALKELGKEDILVIGSGTTVHNLRWLQPRGTEPLKEAVEFDDWIINKIHDLDLESLNNYSSLAPHFNLAVPRAEHIVPLFIAMGSGSGEKPTVIYRDYEMGTFSNLTFEF